MVFGSSLVLLIKITRKLGTSSNDDGDANDDA